jgi:hypothetical protein
MEDTVILKQHYMYMFRVDLEDNNEEKLMKWFEKYHICNWMGKHELGETTGKPHYQMVIWTEHKKSNKEIVKMRKYWTDKLGKATCAIKSARKIESLCSYSSKSKGKTITNLQPQVLARVPKWKNKTAEKLQWNEAIDQLVDDMPPEVRHSKEAYATAILDFHRENHKKPNRANLQYLLWRDGLLSHKDLLIDWRILENYEHKNYF